MSGGSDILIVGVADKNLKYVGDDRKLRDLFGYEGLDPDQYVRDFHTLSEHPLTANPKIFYLAGEHLCGSQVGAGLGYVIFDGNNNAQPRKLDERAFSRIDELKRKFVDEVKSKGLEVQENQVGVYALNVYDT